MVSAPTCSFNSDQYQLRISNSQNVSKNVTLTYSTTEIDGPLVVALPAQQAPSSTSAPAAPLPAISGQSLGLVNVVGPDSCTQSFTLPLCIAQDIVLQSPQSRVSVTPGTTTCTDVLVKNRALQTVKVALTAGSSSPGVSGVFSPNEFMLSSLEVKTVPLCVSAQAGFSGQATLSLAAHSPLGQANESIGVDVFGQTFFSTDFSGCPIIDAGRTTYYSLNVQNNDGAGDFVLHLEDNSVTTRDDFVLQQFQKGDVRQVTIALEPFGNNAGRQLFNAFLKKDGHTVFQQSLCFEVRGSAATQMDVQPNPLDVPRGQSRSALLSVRNVGNLRSEYQVRTDGQPLSVRVSPRSFILEPNQEQVVDVQVSAASSLETKSYVVPLSLYARSALQTADEQYAVDVQCGTGTTRRSAVLPAPVPARSSVRPQYGYLHAVGLRRRPHVLDHVKLGARHRLHVQHLHPAGYAQQRGPRHVRHRYGDVQYACHGVQWHFEHQLRQRPDRYGPELQRQHRRLQCGGQLSDGRQLRRLGVARQHELLHGPGRGGQSFVHVVPSQLGAEHRRARRVVHHPAALLQPVDDVDVHFVVVPVFQAARTCWSTC